MNVPENQICVLTLDAHPPETYSESEVSLASAVQNLRGTGTLILCLPPIDAEQRGG